MAQPEFSGRGRWEEHVLNLAIPMANKKLHGCSIRRTYLQQLYQCSKLLVTPGKQVCLTLHLP